MLAPYPAKTDYNQLYYNDSKRGCCLHCPDAKPGCLCYECRCSRCCWYVDKSMTTGDPYCYLVEDVKVEIKDIKKHTNKAILIQTLQGFSWLPRSKTKIKNGYVEIPRWLADEKELPCEGRDF